MRPLLTLIATLAAQRNPSPRPQPPTTYLRYSADADGNYHEERI